MLIDTVLNMTQEVNRIMFDSFADITAISVTVSATYGQVHVAYDVGAKKITVVSG